jgi:hypothetical protein
VYRVQFIHIAVSSDSLFHSIRKWTRDGMKKRIIGYCYPLFGDDKVRS